MLPVEQPFKTYTGLDGKPLDNGYVWFGQPNQNPQTAPVTVFWDAAGTIPAAQPLRTVNGYIYRGGTPANVFFDGAYSEQVLDSKQRQVFYARTSDEFSIATAIRNFLTSLAAGAGAALVGYIQGATSTVATTVQNKLRERVSAMDYMTAAERADVLAGTQLKDVTAAVQKAIDATAPGGMLIWPKGSYRVTSLTTGRIEANWIFDHSEICAGATTPTNYLIKFSGLHCNIYGMKLNGRFNLNYGCLLWWYNDADSSQHNNFFGMDVRYTKRGIIYGEVPGKASTTYAQSENTIFGLHTRGVERPLYMNHSNGFLFLTSPALSSQDDDWAANSPGNFDNTLNYAFEGYAGVLSINGGELQNSIAAVTSYCAIIQGAVVYLNHVITEVDTPFQLSGQLIISGGQILNTQSSTDQFVIPAGADNTTKLKVNGCKIYRNIGVGSYSANKLVNNVGANLYTDISFDNCDVIDWASFVPAVATNHQSTHFDSVRWYPDGTQDPHYSVYLIDTHGADLLDRPSIDTSGRSADGFFQNLWYGGSTTWGVSTDTPGGSYAGSLAVNCDGQAGYFTSDETSLATLKATATRVKQGDKFLVECWIRFVTGKGDRVGAAMVLYDATGARIAPTPYLRIFDQANFVTSSWQYLRNVITIPAGVAYVGFGAQGVETEVRFCGLKVRRADWNNL